MDFLAKLKAMIQHAVVSGPANNSDQFPVQQITYKGKVSNCMMIFSYGHYANCSSSDTLVSVFEVEGDEDNKAGLGYTPKKRPIDLEPGEHAVYHPGTETFIKFRNNADLHVSTGTGNIIVDCNDLTVNAAGNATVNCEDAILTANNDVTVTAGGDANVTATGNIALEGVLIQNNGTIAGVVTTLSINPLTGLPFPDGSDTVRAGDG